MTIPKVGFNHKKANNAGFEIIDLQSVYQRENISHSPQEPHRVSFFNLILVEQGTGSHMIDFAEYPFRPGSVIMLQREQVQAFDFSSRPKGKMILFTQDFLDKVHANMRLPSYTPTHLDHHYQPVLNLDQETKLSFDMLIGEMVKEIARTDTDPLIVMHLFSSLSLMLQRIRPESHQEKLSKEQNIKFARFFELLQSNFTRTRDANWYADQVHITYKTLNLICKLATNLTAKQLIDSYTILEAKRRLVISSTSTQQLAYDLGFEDASNFVKYFKKNTQITPSQFQKKYTNPEL
ncbi:AraC family transcriptional regulator [Vibrio sp. JC009]|uniref:AraC family transcriptional regulator n=1 Tax=Vibrio sp. JC009 TaxID=2912314 RepID=UPI0023AE8DF5|nr:helix-turn-helix domain-containing protein [Vibrio sp. JC009]WED23757.1 AraC family transcriptional regulator [Vibrio sp. JC009]